MQDVNANGNAYLENLRNIEDIDQTAQRVLITLVVDCSESMIPHFETLQKKFNEFVVKAKGDDDVSRCADLCLVTYGNRVTVPIRPMSITNVDTVAFDNMGQTNTPAALEVAIKEAKEWKNIIENKGMRVWVPWIVLMTDGYTTYSDVPGFETCSSRADMDRVIAMSRQREAEGKHHVFALGMGTGFDVNELRRITDVQISITDWDFDDFFSWLFRSVATMSTPTLEFTDDGGAIDANTGDPVLPVDTGEEFQRMLQNTLKMMKR